MSWRVVLPALLLVFMLQGATPADADCRNPSQQPDATSPQSGIRIRAGGSNLNSTTEAALDAAIAQWNAACGSRVPTLSRHVSSPTVIDVNYEKGKNDVSLDPTACARTAAPEPGTLLAGGDITYFEQSANGADCTGHYRAITAHEIGHRLGLDHSSCPSNVMAAAVEPQARPTTSDCSAVDSFWMTHAETVPCSCLSTVDCDLLFLPPEWGVWQCRNCQCVLTNSPLVLHLPDYFSLAGQNPSWWKRGFCSDSAPTVCLDWQGDGNITCTAWTEPDSQIAFVVSLNNEDMIRLADGLAVTPQPWRHFFGNVTQGPRGGFPFAHGFEALAAHCGLDPDAVEKIDFAGCGASLHAWSDQDGDGRIAFAEILPFENLGIESLGGVRRTDKADKCGNTFPAESQAICLGRSEKCGIWLDVFFESR